MRNILAAVFIATASVCLEAQEAPPPPPQAVEASLPKELSCPGCNLRGANLAGRDLSNANLAGAELSEADFRGATLDGTIFIGANLTGARFDKAKLNAADLSNANLTGAVFDDATMSGVNLQHARLERASLARTTLQGVLAGPHVSLTGEPLAAVGAADDILCGYSDLTTLPKRIYVSNSGADSDSCGTTAAGACKTIQKGFARCTPTKGCGVLVMYGEYPLTETLKYEPDMHLFGGCVPRSRWKPEYFSTILAPPGGVPAIIARGVMVEKSVMQGFQVIGSKGAANGAASVAMLVRAASALHLLNNTIVAGEGGPGAAGQDSTEGTKGGDGNGRTAGTNACGAVNGGKGADVMNVNVHSKGLGFECSPSCPENNCHGYYGGGGSTGTSARGGKWGNG
ncbi:MAG TPA: pentapeptide repeat-containing protein, partial [Thermoanaerobaculia bacterium]|nr:pentapeptide repeat-containing protein [Thermoanaerobaculia bacterium]